MTGAGHATPDSGQSLDIHRVTRSLLSMWNSVAPRAKPPVVWVGWGE